MRASRPLAASVMLVLGLTACGSAVPVGPNGPVAAPQVLCQAVPQQSCRQAFDVTGAAPGSVLQVVVRCSVPLCTNAAGEADVTIRFVDGRTEQSGYGWASAPAAGEPEAPPVPRGAPGEPAVPLAIEPACPGVPLEMCRDMASTGPNGEGVDDTVRAVTVRCTAVCTPLAGQGKTTYEFVDGRAPVTHDWVYENGN